MATLFWVAATLRLLMVAVTNLVGNFQMVQAVVAILFLMEFFLPSFHPQISPFGGISPSKRPSVKNGLLRVGARPLANLIVTAGPHIMAGLDIRG